MALQSLIDESVEKGSTVIAEGRTSVGVGFELVPGSFILQKKKVTETKAYSLYFHTCNTTVVL